MLVLLKLIFYCSETLFNKLKGVFFKMLNFQARNWLLCPQDTNFLTKALLSYQPMVTMD